MANIKSVSPEFMSALANNTEAYALADIATKAIASPLTGNPTALTKRYVDAYNRVQNDPSEREIFEEVVTQVRDIQRGTIAVNQLKRYFRTDANKRPDLLKTVDPKSFTLNKLVPTTVEYSYLSGYPERDLRHACSSDPEAQYMQKHVLIPGLRNISLGWECE